MLSLANPRQLLPSTLSWMAEKYSYSLLKYFFGVLLFLASAKQKNAVPGESKTASAIYSILDGRKILVENSGIPEPKKFRRYRYTSSCWLTMGLVGTCDFCID